MMSMLKVEVIGHLGADAEVKEIRGKKYVAFSVAHKKYHRDNEGNKTETTQWINVLWFGDGHGIQPLLKKGSKVFVRGHQNVHSYTDRSGNTQISISVSASEVVLCSLAQGSDISQI